jgi:Na+/H+-translocating membrane pyrophosphatase
LAAWSTAIALYERDLPERQALEEALKTADNICDGISKVAGFATKLPASVPYVQVVAAAVAVAAQIASGVLDVTQTVLSLFNETDDYSRFAHF